MAEPRVVAVRGPRPHATWGNLTNANTQPFLRTFGGRDWLFAHSGSLRYRLEVAPSERFLPVGSTDREIIFCRLMNLAATRGWRSVSAIDPAFLCDWLSEINAHGGSPRQSLAPCPRSCPHSRRRG